MVNIKEMCVIAVGLGVMLGPVTVRGDYVVGDFEGSDPGTWGFWDGSFMSPVNNDANLELSSADATTGSTSVLATNSGWDQSLAYDADAATRAQFANNTMLQFDVILPATTTDGWWEVYEIVLNPQNGGWTSYTGSALSNSEGGAGQVGWAAGGGGRRVVTYTLDYSNLQSTWTTGPGDWLQVVFALNNDGAHTNAYIDNVRLVPEPASLALLGLAGLALAGRRRLA